MSYSVRLSITNLWHPTSGQNINRFMKDTGISEYPYFFSFDNGSITGSAIYNYGYLAGEHENYNRIYCNRIKCSSEDPVYGPQSNGTLCGWISYDDTSNVSPTINLKQSGFDSDTEFAFDFIYDTFNINTDSWINTGAGFTTSLTLGGGASSPQTGDVIVNINMPFIPIFETEELADDYIDDPTNENIYSQALNYYNPEQYCQPIAPELYLFKNTQKIVQTCIADSMSDNSYSSGLYIENILNPIDRLLKSYRNISFDEKIQNLKDELAKLTKEITDLKSTLLIEGPSSRRGQALFPTEAPFNPKLDLSPFDERDLTLMISYVNTQYNDIDIDKPFYLAIENSGVFDGNRYYNIRVVHPNLSDDIYIINEDDDIQELQYYFDTCNENIRLSGDNLNAGIFKYYIDSQTCDDWTSTTAAINLYHGNNMFVNLPNSHIPFYCSNDIYITTPQGDKEVWLSPVLSQGVMREDEGTADNIAAGMIHIKPIITLFNRYEMSNINGWDGNKLKVGDGYLLAPQVGAGIKNNGLFTGVVMGVKQVKPNKTDGQRIGMFGFDEGVQSFFLNAEDGSAIFGKPGTGQIVIDPKTDKGMLYSSNYWVDYSPKDGKPSSYDNSNYNYQGMLIDFTTPEIRFGNGNFIVNSEGHITAGGGGNVSGWKITDTTIESNVTAANGKLVLDSGATYKGLDHDGNKIYEYSFGKIYSGNHTSFTSTNVNGFYLSKEGLSIGDSIRISSAEGGSIEVGRLSGSRKWIISGDSNNSFIGYNADTFGCTNLNDPVNFRITGNAESVYIGTEGIRLGQKFAVDNTGNIATKHLVVECDASDLIGSWVGNWQFTHENLSSVSPSSEAGKYDRIWFSNHGLIRSEKWNSKPTPGGTDYTLQWEIRPDGTTSFSGAATFSNTITMPNVTIDNTNGIVATKGTIGPFTFDSTSMSGGGINLLTSNGTITATDISATNISGTLKYNGEDTDTRYRKANTITGVNLQASVTPHGQTIVDGAGNSVFVITGVDVSNITILQNVTPTP